MRPARPVTVAITAALLLSSCGKQEAVGDVPSSEELAKQADAASQAIRDEAAAAEAENAGKDGADAKVDTAEMKSYANALRGYTIMVPGNWAADEAASDDNGRTFKDEKSGGALTVNWSENRDDAAWAASVKAVEDAGEKMTGEATKENEYRASGTGADEQKSMLRMLRKEDSTMVSATISYPADQAEALDATASQILDSLTLQ